MIVRSRSLHLLLALALSLVGASFLPAAEATCDVNVGGSCAGDCDVNVLATCLPGGACLVNVDGACGDWTGTYYASCTVNAVDADCTGRCIVNVVLADCAGGCRVNAVAATCDSTACRDHFCIFSACMVNAVVADCHEPATCDVNVASDCWGSCTANLASPDLYLIASIIPVSLGCGETGSCLVNVAARCDGACTVNAAFAQCRAGSTCTFNVLATCESVPLLA